MNDKTEFTRTKMNRKPPLTCCCPQQQQVSGGGFHICLVLQLLLENQNRLHISFDEKISILHASEMRRAPREACVQIKAL